MAFYVVNEWVWSDLANENEPGRRLETFDFLIALSRSDDQILVIRQSPFERKVWNACKSADTSQRKAAGFFVKALHQDSDRCRILGPSDVAPMPDELRRAGVKPDDEYLIQAQQSQPGSTIISTDEPLIRILTEHQIPRALRGPFVADYLKLHKDKLRPR
jgi:hypothetical protein